jgi:hypothetical protein
MIPLEMRERWNYVPILAIHGDTQWLCIRACLCDDGGISPWDFPQRGLAGGGRSGDDVPFRRLVEFALESGRPRGHIGVSVLHADLRHHVEVLAFHCRRLFAVRSNVHGFRGTRNVYSNSGRTGEGKGK